MGETQSKTPEQADGPLTGWTTHAPRRVGLSDTLRCSETGIEIVEIHRWEGPGKWVIFEPRWRGTHRATRPLGGFATRADALRYANTISRPAMRQRIADDHAYALTINAQRAPIVRAAPGFRGGKVPPEHYARLAADVRSQILTMDVGRGSLAEAAGIVEQAVKQAQAAALRAVLAEIDEWLKLGDGFPHQVRERGQIVAEGFREMLDDAARKLGLPESWSRP